MGHTGSKLVVPEYTGITSAERTNPHTHSARFRNSNEREDAIGNRLERGFSHQRQARNGRQKLYTAPARRPPVLRGKGLRPLYAHRIDQSDLLVRGS